MCTVFWGFLSLGEYGEHDWVSDSYVDTMSVLLKTHDMFPKRGLDNLCIGNKDPLCTDNPNRAFLCIWKNYRLLGESSDPTLK